MRQRLVNQTDSGIVSDPALSICPASVGGGGMLPAGWLRPLWGCVKQAVPLKNHQQPF